MSLRRTVERLAEFPTRNSLSPDLRPAVEWLADEYRAIPGMHVEIMEFNLPAGPRVPQETPVCQLIATLPGPSPHLVMQSAHIDSLCLGTDPATGRAPGANDDASGVAVGLEVARYLAASAHRNTLRFVAYCGEEQGLLGSKALAARATAEQWPLLGILNNDMVGSSTNLNGQKEAHALRVYADLPARELARYAEWQVRQAMPDFSLRLHYRADRFGRGGDHTPFALAGFPALRFTEVYEEWAHQHTPEDTPENMDFDLLARSAQANEVIMRSLAASGPAPTQVTFDPAASYHTQLSWQAEPGETYEVYYRLTSAATWEGCLRVGATDHVEIRDLNKDEYLFAVAATGGIPVEAAPQNRSGA
jgi:hypothetical protein